MYSRLIIDGNAVYEIDEECMRRKGRREPQKEEPMKKNRLQPEKKPYQR